MRTVFLAPFTKHCRIGTQPGTGSLYVTIRWSADHRLSITGVEGPKANGDALGGSGQIDMHPWNVNTYAPGWDADMVETLRRIWGEWHLNDMQAGSPAQTAWLNDHPEVSRDYVKASEALAAAGLNPDPHYMRDGKAYRYGSAWLRVDVPESVQEWLRALPDADVPMPARWMR